MLALSVLGFALAAVYAVVGAPDVALVAVVVETVLTLVFVGVFARLPRDRAHDAPARARAGGGAGATPPRASSPALSAFATIWAALSRPTAAQSDAVEHIRRTPDAHGGDVVTVILADFRGLDTMVEITVLAVAIIGVAALLRRGRALVSVDLRGHRAAAARAGARWSRAAIIVKGYTDVGDGFSAGVIVALAIALRYVTLGRERDGAQACRSCATRPASPPAGC